MIRKRKNNYTKGLRTRRKQKKKEENTRKEYRES